MIVFGLLLGLIDIIMNLVDVVCWWVFVSRFFDYNVVWICIEFWLVIMILVISLVMLFLWIGLWKLMWLEVVIIMIVCEVCVVVMKVVLLSICSVLLLNSVL